MKTFRSSILSFDTLNLEGWKAAGLRNEILVAILLLVGAELLARSALAPIGDYWRYWEPEAAVKIEAYRAMVRKGVPPRILIVGDSTGSLILILRAWLTMQHLKVQTYTIWPGWETGRKRSADAHSRSLQMARSPKSWLFP